MKQHHIKSLDGIRGLAILWVLLFHFRFVLYGHGGFAEKIAPVFAFGWVGVDLFFVLSGFLITGILIDTRESGAYLSSFYGRRVLRVFPLYYTFLLFLFVLEKLPWLSHRESLPWAWYVFYLQNYIGSPSTHLRHLWSLAVEEQFYLIWPFIVRFTAPRYLHWACLFLAGAAVGLRIAFGGNGITYQMTPFRLDSLCMGAFMAVAFRNSRLLELVLPWRFAGALVSALVLLVVVFIDRGFTWATPMATFGAFALAVGFAFCVLAAATSKRESILTAPVLRTYGKYSYAIYVLHPILFSAVNFVVQRLAPRLPASLESIVRLACIPVMIVLSLLIAKLSWTFIEQPFLKLKRFFPYETNQAQPRPDEMYAAS